MPFDLKNDLPLVAMPGMLLLVELIALYLSRPLQAAGVEALPYSPENPLNVVVFLVLLLVFTLFILILIKVGVKVILTAIIALSLFFTFYYIFTSLALVIAGESDVAGLASLLLSIGATVLLYKYPEWYVIDTLGILICAGVASIFGIAVGILPALLLLVLLAVYDAISVYRTKHMITLAEGVLSVKAPILFVIPKRRDYSFIREGISIGEKQGGGAGQAEKEDREPEGGEAGQEEKEGGEPEGGEGRPGEKKERGAFIIGMGDLIMPSILVVSAYVFLPVEGWAIPPPAIGAVLGSLAGLALLLRAVKKGKPQAGLPPLNGGTILGFLIGCAVSGAWGWIPGI